MPTSSSIKRNLRQGGSWDIVNGQNHNYEVQSNLLEQVGSLYKLTSTSPAIDSASGAQHYYLPYFDVSNGIRDMKKDIGAEEYSANGNHRPYNINDTTSFVGASSGGLFHCYKEDLILDNLKIPSKDYQTTKRIFARGGLINDLDYLFMAAEDVILLSEFETHNGRLCIDLSTCQN